MIVNPGKRIVFKDSDALFDANWFCLRRVSNKHRIFLNELSSAVGRRWFAGFRDDDGKDVVEGGPTNRDCTFSVTIDGGSTLVFGIRWTEISGEKDFLNNGTMAPVEKKEDTYSQKTPAEITAITAAFFRHCLFLWMREHSQRLSVMRDESSSPPRTLADLDQKRFPLTHLLLSTDFFGRFTVGDGTDGADRGIKRRLSASTLSAARVATAATVRSPGWNTTTRQASRSFL